MKAWLSSNQWRPANGGSWRIGGGETAAASKQRNRRENANGNVKASAVASQPAETAYGVAKSQPAEIALMAVSMTSHNQENEN
jgi:hypothetical protein